MSVVNLIIQTENYRETLTLPLSSYVAGLLDNDSVSIEEKYALYALMELAEQVSSKDLTMDAPLGYDSLTVEPADAPTLSGNIGNIAFDITKNGTVLVVDGTSGTQIAVVFADGTRVEGKIQGGTFRLADIPAYLLLGDITVECGQASYVYSIGVYKKSLNEVYHARADVLYTYAYYAAQMHAASVGA